MVINCSVLVQFYFNMAVPASSKYYDRKQQNPLFQKLSDLNREIKNLKEEEIREKLREFGLNDR